MNGSSDSIDEPSDMTGNPTIGGYGYGLALSLAVVVMFAIITYAFYKCNKHPPPPNRDNNDSSSTDDQRDSITTDYSTHVLTYSQLKPLKTESTASACSICLADYKDTDLVRMLPDCGHMFHPTCIGPWLKLHPTCPICRSSPLPVTPLWSQLALTVR